MIVVVCRASLLLALVPVCAEAQSRAPEVARAIDAYVDARFEAEAGATQALLATLREAGIDDIEAIAAVLKAPRAMYPDVSDQVGKTTVHEVACYHVDYATQYHLYVPAGYRSDVATPLVVVGHGGNSSMSHDYANGTAASYLAAYAPILSRDLKAIVVAPASERGWGNIGNSLILSTISDLQRSFHIDPDRIYVTGHSMGGHMSYRAALSLPDRFAAVSPHSGGYDWVEKQLIGNLVSVPGYVTWGKREPYGIDKDSRTNAAWAEAHGLDWVFVEKDGGHEIYQDELPKVAAFFAERPRDLYRDAVYLRQAGGMLFVKTWEIKGWPEHTIYFDKRPLRWNLRHWLEVTPRPDVEAPITVLAKNLGGNRFEVVSEQLRQFTIWLHPKMVDFAEPVRITANGKQVFEGRVEPDPARMLELVREFDDRGRIFHAHVTVEVEGDQPVELPVTAR